MWVKVTVKWFPRSAPARCPAQVGNLQYAWAFDSRGLSGPNATDARANGPLELLEREERGLAFA